MRRIEKIVEACRAQVVELPPGTAVMTTDVTRQLVELGHEVSWDDVDEALDWLSVDKVLDIVEDNVYTRADSKKRASALPEDDEEVCVDEQSYELDAACDAYREWIYALPKGSEVTTASIEAAFPNHHWMAAGLTTDEQEKMGTLAPDDHGVLRRTGVVAMQPSDLTNFVCTPRPPTPDCADPHYDIESGTSCWGPFSERQERIMPRAGLSLDDYDEDEIAALRELRVCVSLEESTRGDDGAYTDIPGITLVIHHDSECRGIPLMKLIRAMLSDDYASASLDLDEERTACLVKLRDDVEALIVEDRLWRETHAQDDDDEEEDE